MNNSIKKKKNPEPKEEKVKNKHQTSIKKDLSNLNAKKVKKNNDHIEKNKRAINNLNKYNKIKKEKIQLLSLNNMPKFQFSSSLTTKNYEDNHINVIYTNSTLHNHNDKSFNYNNSDLMSHDNNIFCLGDQSSNNITYNKYYNGNTITMNNFYNNFKLNDSNNNVSFITENNKEKEYVINNYDENMCKGNKNISVIKTKLALKLQEEINKQKEIDLFYQDNNRSRSPMGNDMKLYRFSLKDNFKTPNNKYIRNTHNKSSRTNIDKNRAISLKKHLKFQSDLKQNTTHQKYNNLDSYEERNNLNYDGIVNNKHIFNENNKNYQANTFNILNPIKEQNYIIKNKTFDTKAKEQNKTVNNINRNNDNINNKSKINIKEKNINKRTYKGIINKNKELKIENNNKSPNKQYNRKNNHLKEKNKLNTINNNNYTRNNISAAKRKNDNKNTHDIINKSSSTGEMIYNKINNNKNKNILNNRSEKNYLILNKKVECRNTKLKNEGYTELSTKKLNYIKSKNQLKESNITLNNNNNNENNNKSNNRRSIKIRKDININSDKKKFVNKGKINNK